MSSYSISPISILFLSCPPAFFPLSFTDVSYQILSWCQLQTNTVYKIKFFQVIQEERESFKNTLYPLSWEEWWNNENKIKKDRLIKLNDRIFLRQFRQIWNKKEYLEEQERDFFLKGFRRCIQYNYPKLKWLKGGRYIFNCPSERVTAVQWNLLGGVNSKISLE